MKERRFTGFFHGAAVMLNLALLGAALFGRETFAEAVAPAWVPTWLLLVLATVGLLVSFFDMRRAPEELVVIRKVCANCEPDLARGAFN